MAGLKSHAARRVLARNIRRFRQARKMSQEDLAAAARLHQSQISDIESAKISVGIDIIQRLARALGARLADLLNDN
jgi:transcriptional regulator with XRE-family HTH domain